MRILFLMIRQYRILVPGERASGSGIREEGDCLESRTPSLCCGQIYGTGKEVPDI